MAVSSRRVMYYHADASPVGGHLLHPSGLVLPTQGSVALGQAGGCAVARVEQYAPHPSITTGPAYSEVTGAVDQTSGNWTTVVTATVENVNLFGTVTADKIVSRLAIEHPRFGYYPCVSFAGCAFENLRIGGQAVTAKLDLTMLAAEPPVEDIAGAAPQEAQANLRPVTFPGIPWPEVAGFVHRAVAQHGHIANHEGAPQSVKDRYAWMSLKDERTKKGYIACSLVEEIQGTSPASTFGHIVQVPGFGIVYLGELIVDVRSFHLTMLRAELSGGVSAPESKSAAPHIVAHEEDGDGGNVSFGTTHGNGTSMP